MSKLVYQTTIMWDDLLTWELNTGGTLSSNLVDQAWNDFGNGCLLMGREEFFTKMRDSDMTETMIELDRDRVIVYIYDTEKDTEV